MQGAVVVAIGSSFPELSNTVISTLVHGEFELGVAAIVGSALFNIMVIPALSGLASRVPLQANRDLVYKEAKFYMIAVAALTLTFAFAVIYYPVNDASKGGAIQGEMTRWLALTPIALYGLYLFVQYQDTMDHESDDDIRNIRPGREWFRLLLSLLIIVAGVEGLVQAALTFATIMLFLMMRTQMTLSRAESVVLLLVYGLFLVWISLEIFGVIDSVPHLPPARSGA